MDKSPDAFRTISEVSEFLETPAHVLRFWESRFPQIRPVKRAGGRRYYRPADVALLTGIKRLLHDEGMTIRGVQKILREQGVRHVAGLTGDAHGEDAEAALEAALAANFPDEAQDAAPLPPEVIETAQIVALETALRRNPPPRPPVQENLFAGLFDGPEADPVVVSLTPERPTEPESPAIPAEPEIFQEVTEALAPEVDEAPPEEEEAVAALVAAELEADWQAEVAAEDAIWQVAAPETPQDAATMAVPAATELPDLPALAARIAALPVAALLPWRARLRSLRDRLLTLEDRMTAPPY